MILNMTDKKIFCNNCKRLIVDIMNDSYFTLSSYEIDNKRICQRCVNKKYNFIGKNKWTLEYRYDY